jgi:hypothetical protein
MGKSMLVEKEGDEKIKKKIDEEGFNFKEWIVIDPMTMKYQIFKLIIIIDSIYSSLFYAVYAAFRSDLDYNDHTKYLELSNDTLINPITEEAIGSDFKQMMILESFFLCAIFLGFFTSYTDEHTGNIVKDIPKIADRYLHGQFVFDFITIFPLFFRFKFSRLLILIKCLRLVNLKQALDVNTVMA